VYLHHVFDLWIEAWRKKVAVGEMCRTEAERFLASFRERLAKFGLELHADKTRLIEFGQFAERNRKRRGEGKPETFTFLGFTHYCGKRRSNGTFIVWRKTAKEWMVAKLRGIKAVLVRRRHDPSAQVGEWLKKVVQGYYQYHAVPGNLSQLSAFRHRLWQAVASHFKSAQPARSEALAAVVSAARTLDSFPTSSAPLSSSSLRRHASKIRAVCVNALVRICAGGGQRWSSLPRQWPLGSKCAVNDGTCPVFPLANNRAELRYDYDFDEPRASQASYHYDYDFDEPRASQASYHNVCLSIRPLQRRSGSAAQCTWTVALRRTATLQTLK
jgi:hypothetical protein